MKISFDKTANAAYVKIKAGKIAKTIVGKDGMLVDLDAKGNILGYEILNCTGHILKPATNQNGKKKYFAAPNLTS
jgi:uncharacterized protein YuzE